MARPRNLLAPAKLIWRAHLDDLLRALHADPLGCNHQPGLDRGDGRRPDEVGANRRSDGLAASDDRTALPALTKRTFGPEPASNTSSFFPISKPLMRGTLNARDCGRDH